MEKYYALDSNLFSELQSPERMHCEYYAAHKDGTEYSVTCPLNKLRKVAIQLEPITGGYTALNLILSNGEFIPSSADILEDYKISLDLDYTEYNQAEITEDFRLSDYKVLITQAQYEELYDKVCNFINNI